MIQSLIIILVLDKIVCLYAPALLMVRNTHKMLSIAKCLEILNNNQDANESARKYTNEDAASIREALMVFATIEFENYKQNWDEEAGNIIYPSIDRRTNKRA